MVERNFVKPPRAYKTPHSYYRYKVLSKFSSGFQSILAGFFEDDDANSKSSKKNIFFKTMSYPGTFIMDVEAEMFRSKSGTISEYCGGNLEIG
jgi:hypothetical protein